MDTHQRVLRFGAWVILGTLLLRLVSGGFFDPLLKLLQNDDFYSIML